MTLVGGPTPPRKRLRSAVANGRRSALWCLLLLLAAALIQGLTMTRSPQRGYREGEYTALAWNLVQQRALSPDAAQHGLGWLTVAAWAGLTNGFARYPAAVMAGREAMLVLHLVSVALLWLLARRLGLSRAVAATAVALYALSPLAVTLHREVGVANAGTPWLLAAWVLVLAPRRRVLTALAATVCFAGAVLSHGGFLVFLPFLAWSLARRDAQGRRIGAFFGAAITLGLGAAAYLTWSLIGSAPLPTAGLFAPDTSASLGALGGLDPVLPVLAALGAIVCLFNRPLRPVAVALLVAGGLAVSGLVGRPSVTAVLPLAALVAAGSVAVALAGARRLDRRHWGLNAVAVTAVVVVAALVAVPLWSIGQRRLQADDAEAPGRQAQAWLADNVSPQARLLVDNSWWIDLTRAGRPAADVARTDRAVPGEWRDYDILVVGAATDAPLSEEATQALTSSQTLASFGPADAPVEIRRILPEGVAAADQRERDDAAQRRTVGAALVKNDQLRMTPDVRSLIEQGRLDPRALVLLPRAATLGELNLAALPLVRGESDAQRPRRQILITGRDGAFLSDADVARLRATFTEQDQRYRAESVTPLAGSVRVTWSVDYPTGLFA